MDDITIVELNGHIAFLRPVSKALFREMLKVPHYYGLIQTDQSKNGVWGILYYVEGEGASPFGYKVSTIQAKLFKISFVLKKVINKFTRNNR